MPNKNSTKPPIKEVKHKLQRDRKRVSTRIRVGKIIIQLKGNVSKFEVEVDRQA